MFDKNSKIVLSKHIVKVRWAAKESSTARTAKSVAGKTKSGTEMPKKTMEGKISNEILDYTRTGSALKTDKYRAFNDIIDNYAGEAVKTRLENADLYQLEGVLNGVEGRFEWIIQKGKVTHRMFVPGGTIKDEVR